MKAFFFDLDGTLANCEHRLKFIKSEPKDWRAFFAASIDDVPIDEVCRLFIACRKDAKTIILSGRSDECREDTLRWLKKHNLFPDVVYMRKEGDHRPDYAVKKDLLNDAIDDGYEPILFVDDRKQVVDMWRSEGYICLQVAPGDF